MKDKRSAVILQKTFEGISDGFAYCEVLTNKSNGVLDYRFLLVNSSFELQLNRNVGSTVGKTVREINLTIEQSWIDILGSFTIDGEQANFTYFDADTERNYQINTFSEEHDRFAIVIRDITAEASSSTELVSQRSVNEKCNIELVLANKELIVEIDTYNMYTADLEIANIELLLQKGKRKKRAARLVVATKELAFQKSAKEKRSRELTIAKKELQVQKIKKEKIVSELIILKNKSQHSERIKSYFLAKMSREIREPLNGILGLSGLLNTPNLTNNERHDYINIIEGFGGRVLVELDQLVSFFKPNFMQFEQVIQLNIYSNLSVTELASICNMSLSSFKRKFAELYTISPIKYFMKIKIENACELLKDSNNSISNIASEVGFYSVTTFNRAFKSRLGKSPSEFRMNETD